MCRNVRKTFENSLYYSMEISGDLLEPYILELEVFCFLFIIKDPDLQIFYRIEIRQVYFSAAIDSKCIVIAFSFWRGKKTSSSTKKLYTVSSDLEDHLG